MEISVLSMQSVNNFGSLLQAYALKSILNSLDNNVHFIDILPNNEDNSCLDEVNVFDSESERKHSFISKIDRYFLNRLINKFRQKKQNKLFEIFRKDILKINSEDNDKQYDLCIIGSDEVFNALNKCEWGFTTHLYGNINNARKIITYAACCGATTYDKLNTATRVRISNSFKNITSFSVRDNNTKLFVNSLSENKNVFEHFDPVIIYDFEKEIEFTQMRCGSKYYNGEKYCIVYSYHNRIHDEKEIKFIKEFCKKNSLKIITVGAPQKWINQHISVDPFEMLLLFKHASFVITDTFHGTIFAYKYCSHFATIVRDSNSNKLSDLIMKLGIKHNQINDCSRLDSIEMFENDIVKSKDFCKKEYARSLEYLKGFLG